MGISFSRLLVVGLLFHSLVYADTYVVTSTAPSGAGSLANAIDQANLDPSFSLIVFADGLEGIPVPQEFVINSTLTIDGGSGVTLDMGNASRAFQIEGGTVELINLSLENGRALGGAGGNGGSGGGGGAGLGGAIYITAGDVTLTGVNFSNNTAQGGAGGSASQSDGGGGGGGGMAASGGPNNGTTGGAGGGPEGGAAGTGGEDDDSGENDSYIGQPGGNGGIFSGGGGGGTGTTEEGFFGTAVGAGGSGGDGGATGGGGGGGGGHGSTTVAQDGKDGGDGGSGGWGAGGGGGGSGGKGTTEILAGSGGSGGDSVFGGGSGGAGTDGDTFDDGIGGGGGGGLGAGGAVFVSSGASLAIIDGGWSGNHASGGAGGGSDGHSGDPGLSLGAALFLGADVTYYTSAGGTVTIDSALGGADNAYAEGSLIKTGFGTLRLTAENVYPGATLLHEGTLWLDGGSIWNTSHLSVGAVDGDSATLMVSDAVISMSTSILLGATSGADGTFIYSGDASFINAPSILGGAGGGVVRFETTVPVFEMETALEGNLSAVIDTENAVRYRINAAYSGPTQILDGTLLLAVAQESASAFEINGGALELENGIQAGTGPMSLHDGSISGAGTIVAQGAVSVSGTSTIADVTLQNGLTLESGTLLLSGASIRGEVLLESGVAALSGGGIGNHGTGDILIVGAGGSATLDFIGGTFAVSDFILGQGENGFGTLNINGSDAPDVTRIHTADGGAGVVQFNQLPETTFATLLEGNLALAQVGAGVTVLETAQSYQGGTTVTDGRLVVGDAHALGSGDLAVSGQGVLSFLAALEEPLTLEIGGSVAVREGGALAFRLFEPGLADSLNIAGTLELDGTILLTLMDGYQPEAGDRFTLLSAANGLSLESLIIPGHWRASVENGIGGSQSLVITAVPEPDALWLLMPALGLAWWQRRRRSSGLKPS